MQPPKKDTYRVVNIVPQFQQTMRDKLWSLRRSLAGTSFVFGLLCVVFAIWAGTRDSLDPPAPARTTLYDLSYNPQVPKIEKNRTQIGEEKATIFMLVRNSELQEALNTMRQIEDRFNKNYRYPWTFLNDDVFTEEVSKKKRKSSKNKRTCFS